MASASPTAAASRSSESSGALGPAELQAERLNTLITEVQDRFLQLLGTANIGRTRLVPKEDLFDLGGSAADHSEDSFLGVDGSGGGHSFRSGSPPLSGAAATPMSAGSMSAGSAGAAAAMEEVPEEMETSPIDPRELVQLAQLQSFQAAYQASALAQAGEQLLQLISDQKVRVALMSGGDHARAARAAGGGASSDNLHASLRAQTQRNQALLDRLSSEIAETAAQIEQFLQTPLSAGLPALQGSPAAEPRR